MGSSPTRGSSFFLGKVTALGELCCFALFVCLTLLASFFLPSQLSLKHVYMLMTDGSKQGHTNNMSNMSYMYIHVYPGIDSPGAGAQYIERVKHSVEVGGFLQ